MSHEEFYACSMRMIQFCSLKIAMVKFLLYCFEEMLGLKINYTKSEVFVVGCDEQEQYRIASLLNCEVGHFLLKYLGIPVAPKKLLLENFTPVCDACFDNIPTYMMGFYKLNEGIHAKLDSIQPKNFGKELEIRGGIIR